MCLFGFPHRLVPGFWHVATVPMNITRSINSQRYCPFKLQARYRRGAAPPCRGGVTVPWSRGCAHTLRYIGFTSKSLFTGFLSTIAWLIHLLFSPKKMSSVKFESFRNRSKTKRKWNFLNEIPAESQIQILIGYVFTDLRDPDPNFKYGFGSRCAKRL